MYESTVRVAIQSKFDEILLQLLPWQDDPSTSLLLAHYTTISTFERIVRNEEFWFSHPLYMNDHEEFNFGFHYGVEAVNNDGLLLQACGSAERASVFITAFNQMSKWLASTDITDYYIFCTSEHSISDEDGSLEMWRAYGGNGAGVAVVLNGSSLGEAQMPLFRLGKVRYGTKGEREGWITDFVVKFLDVIAASSLMEHELRGAAALLLSGIKRLSLFLKHDGFKGEKEWRLVYAREWDAGGTLVSMLDYNVGPHGIEHKLKFKTKPISGHTSNDLSLESLIERILLGPTISANIAKFSVERMLKTRDRGDLAARLRASSIPFRTKS